MAEYQESLEAIVAEFAADSGTIHTLGAPGMLHLRAATRNIPEAVLNVVREVPVGKGMAGLCVERAAPVDACNIQTDTSGDVRPGARATGLQGAIVVPMLDEKGAAMGALGVANFRERTFTEEEIARLVEHGRRLAAL